MSQHIISTAFVHLSFIMER